MFRRPAMVPREPPEWNPALRQRVVEPMGPLGQPRLVVDPHFDLDFHVALYQLPVPGTWDVLMRDLRRQIMADLDRDRPLCRGHRVEGPWPDPGRDPQPAV